MEVFGSVRSVSCSLSHTAGPCSDLVPGKHTDTLREWGLRSWGKPDLIRLLKPALFTWEEILEQEPCLGVRPSTVRCLLGVGCPPLGPQVAAAGHWA